MGNMDAEIAFVKEQIIAQDKMASKYEAQPQRVKLHLQTKTRFETLLNKLVDLEFREREGESVPSSGNSKLRGLPGLNLSLADIDGLPPELLGELSLSESDRQEMMIADIIMGYGGVASLDKILVSLYRRSGAIVKRNTMVSKLYRMAEKRMIYNIPGKRGIYSSYELSSEEAEKLLGRQSSDSSSDDNQEEGNENQTHDIDGKKENGIIQTHFGEKSEHRSTFSLRRPKY
jgi:hypothetical protein